jgi:hypothetical protein
MGAREAARAVSEMRRAAASLVAHRTERFESAHGLAASKARLDAALDRARIARPWPFEARWSETPVILEVGYAPSRAAKAFLNLASLAFVLLVAGSAAALMNSDNEALRFLLPLVTVLLVLGFPFVSLALASNRSALEARIRRAIRAALQDEDEKYPPPRRWADEER